VNEEEEIERERICNSRAWQGMRRRRSRERESVVLELGNESRGGDPGT
jgi:hypothetical protein